MFEPPPQLSLVAISVELPEALTVITGSASAPLMRTRCERRANRAHDEWKRVRRTERADDRADGQRFRTRTGGGENRDVDEMADARRANAPTVSVAALVVAEPLAFDAVHE